MSKNDGRIMKSIAGGLIATILTPVLGFLAWPMFIFERLFPDDCPPEALICLWSDKAIFATLATEVLIYSLLTYLMLKLDMFHLERTSYVGKV